MKNRFSILGRYILLILISASLTLVSCKGQKNNTREIGGSEDFKMNCVMLTRAQVQVWVDSGWTKPTDPQRIRTLLFQFYSPEASQASSNMELLAYPGSSWSDVRVNGRTNLSVDTNCVALKLSGRTIFANNVVNLNSLNILDKDGKLKDFDFIRFRPEKVDGEYISFNIEVVKVINSKETTLSESDTYPCPPHCPPAPPEER